MASNIPWTPVAPQNGMQGMTGGAVAGVIKERSKAAIMYGTVVGELALVAFVLMPELTRPMITLGVPAAMLVGYMNFGGAGLDQLVLRVPGSRMLAGSYNIAAAPAPSA